MRKQLLLLALMLSVTSNTFALNFEGLSYSLSDSTAEVISTVNNYSGDIVIPRILRYMNKNYTVTSIGEGAFFGCTGLTSIYIPNSVTRIKFNAFSQCSSLTSIRIPSSVTSIEDGFVGCSGLTSIVVESGNSVYDSRDNCNAIIRTADNTLIQGCKSTTIPNSVTSIGGYAFHSCTSLISIMIPNSVVSIGDWAFEGCSGLTSITIGNSVKSIGSCAFQGCIAITSFNIPNSVTSIGAYAFNDTGWYNNQSKGLLYLCNWFLGYKSAQPAGDLLIDDGTRGIGGHALYRCRGLDTVTIPSSVTSIGEWAFKECSSLTSVTIPNSVTSIGEHAFSGCCSLTSIMIPNCVTSIGTQTFKGCSNLTSITIGNNVTSIGKQAFSGCASLTSVTIPNSVTSIGEYAFRYCSSLTDIYCYPEMIPNTVIWQYPTFANTPISNITLHVPTASIDAYKTTKPWNDFKEIVALTDGDPKPTGIKTVELQELNENNIYDLTGHRLVATKKGLNIIRMSNGKTQKVVVK